MKANDIYVIAKSWIEKDHENIAVDWIKLMAEDLERRIKHQNEYFMGNQKFRERISDIIESKIDSEKSVKEQIVFASKKLTIAFWEANHEWEPQLGDTKARNVFNGEEKEVDELLNEFLSKYRLD